MSQTIHTLFSIFMLSASNRITVIRIAFFRAHASSNIWLFLAWKCVHACVRRQKSQRLLIERRQSGISLAYRCFAATAAASRRRFKWDSKPGDGRSPKSWHIVSAYKIKIIVSDQMCRMEWAIIRRCVIATSTYRGTCDDAWRRRDAFSLTLANRSPIR